jgi:hypothetical protein
VLEHGERVEAIGVVDEAVLRARDANDRRNESVSPLETCGVLVKGTEEPLPDRPESHDPHTHVVHRVARDAVMMTITGGKIVEINLVADPDRLRRLDVAILDD